MRRLPLRCLWTVAAALLLSPGCVPAPSPGPAPAGSAPKSATEDFLGTWAGAWDGVWQVQFTVTPGPKPGELSVAYQWVETLGQPPRSQQLAGTLRGGCLFTDLVEIWVSAGDPEQATAVGKFARRRTAALRRLPDEQNPKAGQGSEGGQAPEK